MEIFCAALALWGAKTNLTARPQDPGAIAFHIVDSLTPLILELGQRLSPLPDQGNVPHIFAIRNRILDFGSGAGFPGLVLASACEARFTLVEARRKRASFLTVVAAEMGLVNVELMTTRLAASTLAPGFDAVVSRASGPAAEFYDIAASALLPRGLAILYSSPSQRLDFAAAKKAGLSGHRSYRYSLRRGGTVTDRILSIWHKPEKHP
ncbi:MAG TPA: RsmG family class I SAM-dependent methyltransferase [Candidatus Binataceae bacterium]